MTESSTGATSASGASGATGASSAGRAEVPTTSQTTTSQTAQTQAVPTHQVTGYAEPVTTVAPPVTAIAAAPQQQSVGGVVARPAREDRVRWSAVWAGTVVALATYLLLQLAFFAFDWLDLATVNQGLDSGEAWTSAILAAVAFALGGLTAAASATWRRVSDGILHGILVWALGVVAILFIVLFQGGALLGNLADVLLQSNVAANAGPEGQPVVDVARETAEWALLTLGLTVLAAVLGGLAGVKLWPGKDARHEETIDLR